MPSVQPSQNTGKSEWVIHGQTPPGLKKETTLAFGQLAGNKAGNKGKHRRSSWVCGAERSSSAACVGGEPSFAEPHGGNAAGHRTPRAPFPERKTRLSRLYPRKMSMCSLSVLFSGNTPRLRWKGATCVSLWAGSEHLVSSAGRLPRQVAHRDLVPLSIALSLLVFNQVIDGCWYW